MCGFAGFVDLKRGMSKERLEGVASDMSATLAHRGPDDSGVWSDPLGGVALGFRRLSILDLSEAGHQPMLSSDGRYAMVYNGEIYNFATLKAELEARGRRFRGHSDTEVFLEGICEWGLESAVKRCNGMFAFALWDVKERSLSLGRDRIGIKPLYYGWSGECLLFGSELKAFRRHPAFDNEIDRNALALLMRYNYITAPYSIFKNVWKVPQGSFLEFREGAFREPRKVEYWSASSFAGLSQASPFKGDAGEWVEGLERALSESIAERMVADVPVGAFLSGGIDSSLVVALMQRQSVRPVKTFTIGFSERDYDEAPFAKRVARHLGTDHMELYVSPKEAMDVIPSLPTIFDEPFSDSSQIPTLLVSRLARTQVAVSLSGDGGDELFCGYGRYFHFWEQFRNGVFLEPEAKTLGIAVKQAHRGGLKAFLKGLAWRMKAAGMSKEALYLLHLSHWTSPCEFVKGAKEPPTAITDPSRRPECGCFTEMMMHFDMGSYLPDDIMVKVDRASMSASLESRAPFIDDHRVVEYALRTPLGLKVRDGKSKWILREILARHVPRELFERPKMGFGVPIGNWLREPLRDWAEELLSEKSLREGEFFNPVPVRDVWGRHLGGADYGYWLWDVLMFQAWRKAWEAR